MNLFKKTLKSTSGQGMSEYLILVLLIAVTSITATRTVGTAVKDQLGKVKDRISHLGQESSGSRRGSSTDTGDGGEGW